MPDTQSRFDVKSFIQQQAEESGMTASDAVLFAEKCYDGMPLWQPFGGAQSFEDIATKEAADLYQGNVNQLTYQLQAVIGNIMNNENLAAGEKSSAISKAAADYETKMSELDISKGPVEQGTKNLGLRFLEALKGKKKRPEGSDPSLTPEQTAVVAAGAKEVVIGQGFKMFLDNRGELRWLSFSTNAFEDHSKELFSTKSIEEAIEWSEKMGDRGPLRVFHVEGADIGTCDFQAMSGRFLIESGTFDNTVLGQKAVQYLEAHPEKEWQVSVGYYYKEHDDEDGTYDWMRIKERSILPAGMADNPFTGFWTQHNKSGEKAMHTKAKGVLEDLFGPEITAGVIAKAEEGTKQLEEAGVRFKMKEDEFGEITDVEEVTATAGAEGEGSKEAKPEPVLMSHEHGSIKHKHRVLPESEHEHTNLVAYKAGKMPAEDAKDGGKDDDQENADGSKKAGSKEAGEGGAVDVVKLATVIGNLVERVEAMGEIGEAVKGLQEGVKALQASEEERMGSFLSTKFTLPGGIAMRPTEGSKNVIDATKEGVKELVNPDGSAAEQEVNPARVYIEDLLGRTNLQQG